jgi:hypothetical protein
MVVVEIAVIKGGVHGAEGETAETLVVLAVKQMMGEGEEK